MVLGNCTQPTDFPQYTRKNLNVDYGSLFCYLGFYLSISAVISLLFSFLAYNLLAYWENDWYFSFIVAEVSKWGIWFWYKCWTANIDLRTWIAVSLLASIARNDLWGKNSSWERWFTDSIVHSKMLIPGWILNVCHAKLGIAMGELEGSSPFSMYT